MWIFRRRSLNIRDDDSTVVGENDSNDRGAQATLEEWLIVAASTSQPAATPISRSAIAGNLQLARTIFNLSQENLGAQCKLNRTHISAIERQELNVGIDTIERIARVFSVPAYVLLMPKSEAQALLHAAFSAHV